MLIPSRLVHTSSFNLVMITCARGSNSSNRTFRSLRVQHSNVNLNAVSLSLSLSLLSDSCPGVIFLLASLYLSLFSVLLMSRRSSRAVTRLKNLKWENEDVTQQQLPCTHQSTSHVIFLPNFSTRSLSLNLAVPPTDCACPCLPLPLPACLPAVSCNFIMSYTSHMFHYFSC